MYIDKQNQFSDAQALTTTAASTNVIDLGANSALVQTLFSKGMVNLSAQVQTAFAGGTSVAIALQTDDNASFSSAKTLWTGPAIVTASLVAGYVFQLPPLPTIGLERFIRLNYVIVGTHTAGAVDANLVLDLQSNGV